MKKSISLWLRRRWGHFLFWVCFITYELAFATFAFGIKFNFLNYMLHYVITISWCYFSANYALPWGVSGGSKWRLLWKIPAIIIALSAFTVFGNILVDMFVMKFGIMPKKVPYNPFDIVWNLKLFYRYFFIFLLSLSYFYVTNFKKEQKKNVQLIRQKLSSKIKQEKMQYALSKSNNDFLRAQINPHFLFNTLDYVYHNISIESPDAAEAVLTLADMMRYAVSTNEDDDFVLMDDEVEQVEKLIYLYQLRKDNSLRIESYFSEQVRQIRFIPLILLTLVENIFKHGDVSDVEHGVVIEALLEDECLVIKTKNALNQVRARRSTNSGLSNIADRLEFCYGKDVVFNYGVLENLFVAEVRVPLQAIVVQEDRRLLLTPHFN